MKEKKIKVVTYLRVAANEQASIFRKTEELRELLSEHDDWEIVDQVYDYGVSGRKFERPGLNRVLELCKEKEVDMVVTLDSYMLARDVLVYKQIYTTVRDYGVELFISELKKKSKGQKKEHSNFFVRNLCPAV